MSTENLLTIKEAAECLGLNPMTVRRWLTAKGSKLLPNARKVKTGNIETWFIPQSDVNAVRNSADAFGRKPNNPAEDFDRYIELETRVAALEAVSNERLAWIQSLEAQLKTRGDEFKALLTINMELISNMPRTSEVSN
jgi:excisionase family DNA binding protein